MPRRRGGSGAAVWVIAPYAATRPVRTKYPLRKIRYEDRGAELSGNTQL